MSDLSTYDIEYVLVRTKGIGGVIGSIYRLPPPAPIDFFKICKK